MVLFEYIQLMSLYKIWLYCFKFGVALHNLYLHKFLAIKHSCIPCMYNVSEYTDPAWFQMHGNCYYVGQTMSGRLL